MYTSGFTNITTHYVFKVWLLARKHEFVQCKLIFHCKKLKPPLETFLLEMPGAKCLTT